MLKRYMWTFKKGITKELTGSSCGNDNKMRLEKWNVKTWTEFKRLRILSIRKNLIILRTP
jgi:hypothetical protein